jgi:predicted Rossmann fold flavoprotein
MNTSYHLIIIGAGPAGIFAALSAVEADPDLKVLILEKGQAPLAKVKVSGGGRCNLTHTCYDPRELTSYYPRGGKELLGSFTRFQPADTMAWFEEHGVELKAEKDGRVFPASDDSQTIIDCLLGEIDKFGVELRTGVRVEGVSLEDGGFRVSTSDAGELTTQKVLIATGGGSAKMFKLAAALSHNIIPPVPSLFTFNIKDPRIEGLSGVSMPDVALLLPDHKISARGPLLITHWGLSGPAVLSLSAWGARVLHDADYKMNLMVDFMPKHDLEELAAIILEKKDLASRSGIAKNVPYKFIPVRLWSKFLTKAGINQELTWREIADKKLRRLAHLIKFAEFQIEGKGEFKDEFVTCGGVDLKEINFKSFESKSIPGLYFAGEVLNIDGLTGGFNFQSAWTAGWLAGKAIASN